MDFDELNIDPNTLTHREKLDEVFALFNGKGNQDILRMNDPEQSLDMTIGEVRKIAQESHDIVMQRIVAEGACPDCLQEVVVDTIDSMGVAPHPVLVAFCITWFTVGLHIGNNRS